MKLTEEQKRDAAIIERLKSGPAQRLDAGGGIEMTVAEILADNLRRLMNGKTVGEWTAENPTINNYYDHQWMLKLLEGATPLTSLETLDHIAAHAGVAPWQLLAPLCGRAVWSPNPNGSLSLRTLPYCRRVGSIMVYTHTVMSEVPGRDPVMTHHDTEANARAAVEAALFEGGK